MKRSTTKPDPLSWYARKAARAAEPLPGVEPSQERVERLRGLLEELEEAGIKGDFEHMTLYTRRLPPGCRSCVAGKGTNVYVTGLCTRDCFFCFNQKPRKDELVVHGIPVREPEEAAEIVRRYGLRSVGLSGGEPLMFPERVLRLLSALKTMRPAPLVDLYTNGDRADEALLRRLQDAGLDGIRFDAAARDYDLAPIALARRIFEDVSVEIPVIPEDRERLERLVLDLDALRVPFLNIHELFLCAENSARVVGEGQTPLEDSSRHLLWRPTAESGEAALELLLFALRRASHLSVYYCSTGTQEMIAARGLRRRRRAAAACGGLAQAPGTEPA
ncbi:MAG: radical SAM protein [Elusimicrobia bacterium]|nr:radical SAM protein [Elusimicrobiota bacterium]